MRREFLIIIAVFFLLAAYSCTNRIETYKKTKPLMDTLVSITVVAGSRETAERAADKAFSVIEKFSSRIDFYSDESELSEINRNAGMRKVAVSPDTFDLISRAIYSSESSQGAFDATIGPIMKLWDFHKKILPSEKEVNKYLPLVNYRDIITSKADSSVLLRKKGMLLDLGGIAKGYAADLAVESLKNDGVISGLVAIAGDIKTFGLKPDGKPWIIGLKNPRQKSDRDEIMATISLTDKAISTSGDYERYFIQDNIRYHHLIDPKSGYPVNCCRSVSIIADKGVTADAFSTAVFILGPEKGMKLIEQMGADAIIIDNQGNLLVTENIREKLVIEKGN